MKNECNAKKIIAFFGTAFIGWKTKKEPALKPAQSYPSIHFYSLLFSLDPCPEEYLYMTEGTTFNWDKS
ncbi:hypothetical protein GCM10010917_40470 [Paenibacillus physcomitrellae]|uniref:Uncharacterized protein n=1 Tax=Paenibacillus physcomitrellae TaxID=1619311 RepID=A0ABQ1GVJ3_9BACL|nr:hypothetical protein GCM10010917_40470 [Paenibacillus physcomitrellae]